MFSLKYVFYPALLSYLAQPTPLEPDYAAFIQAVNCGRDPIFRQGPNVVSKEELDAHNHVLRNYMNCMNEVRNELSFLKDAWFTSALLVPLMTELVRSELFTKKYKFTTYVSLLDLCLVFKIERSRNSWKRRSMGFPNFGKRGGWFIPELSSVP